jgi:hypothetical protein
MTYMVVGFCIGAGGVGLAGILGFVAGCIYTQDRRNQ